MSNHLQLVGPYTADAHDSNSCYGSNRFGGRDDANDDANADANADANNGATDGTITSKSYRSQAEAHFFVQKEQSNEAEELLTPIGTRLLLHELRVHQIQLEMQNEDLRKVHRELEASRARYFDLYDLAPVGYCTINQDRVILESNLATATLLGVKRTELIERSFDRFMHVSEIEHFALLCKTLLNTERTGKEEFQMVRRDGTLFWGGVTAVAAKDEIDRPILRIVLTDKTENRQNQEELRVAAIAFESQEGMFITDADTRIIRVNQAFTKICGYQADEVVGERPGMFSSGSHDQSFYKGIWDSIWLTGSWQGEIWNRRKNGEVFPQWLTITVVRNEIGRPTHYVGTFSDISARKIAEDQIKNLVYYDPLTNLPNRRLLMERLAQALASGARHPRKGALLFIDLDNFKTLNDTLGHYQGDLLLEQVALRLCICVREGDTVARLGGDEFVVMLENLGETLLEAATQAEAVGEKILLTLNQPYQLDTCQYHCGSSIGVTLFGIDPQEGIDEPLKRADLAMYQAKAAGRNVLCFFDPEMQAVVTSRAAMEVGLREAIKENQLLLHYQAQVDTNGNLTGAEALVRWQHPQDGLVGPAEFIPMAEESSLILLIGAWVLEAACAQLAAWGADPAMAHLTLAVNVSPRQFRQADFVQQVMKVLTSTGANPQRLKLELTEGVLIKNVEDVIEKMCALKAIGVVFSLDDFGTGYSSLSYLKRLPLDQLKIDQSFVRDLLTEPNDAAIARAIMALSQTLDLHVIAEGVETNSQRNFLASIGCDAYQGFYFGSPVTAKDLADFVPLARSADVMVGGPGAFFDFCASGLVPQVLQVK
jgi:diguanylate cyclase (GGDEF)-like protein/PAS domain S-box-containing protein